MLEKIGKFCFSKVSPLIFYTFLLAPLLTSTGYFLVQVTKISELAEPFYISCKKGKSALQKKKKKDLFIQRYSPASPYFLDEQIESLSFLQKEQTELRMLIQHPALADKQFLEKRLMFLTSANRFSFAEEAIRMSSSMKETEERQKTPVEMSEEDLKRVLSLVEDISIESYPSMEKRPQLIITQFHLKKKETPVKTHVFEVDMRFTKREFIQ